MSVESQRSIADWAYTTFGYGAITPAVYRSIEEMKEFIYLIDSNSSLVDTSKALLEEAADIVITLYVLADKLNLSLHDAVDDKMRVNRNRRWEVHGDGTGHHIKEPQQ